MITMDIGGIEELIELSQVDNPRKEQSSRMLDQLRQSSERWSIGLNLFFESHNDVARFFGLSLVRDFLGSIGATSEFVQIRSIIRESLMQWIFQLLAHWRPTAAYLYNNVVAILTLLVKADYPEHWPTAFQELLQLGRQSTEGLDLLLKVLSELEVEVVVFDERRQKDEIAHNTVIKDTMRSSTVISDIVSFLCISATNTRSLHDGSYTRRCLEVLSSFVGWIDLNLVIQESTLSVIYNFLGDRKCNGAACSCLLELTKKGMDTVPKLTMLNSIRLLDVLKTVPFGTQTVEASSSGCILRSNKSFQTLERLHSPVVDIGDDDTETDGCEEEFGMMVDTVLLEVLGCWMKFEESQFCDSMDGGRAKTGKGRSRKENGSVSENEDFASLAGIAPGVAGMLAELWPLAMKVFSHQDSIISSTVVPSLNKFIACLKQQQQLTSQDLTLARAQMPNYFVSREHLNELLIGIYKSSQFDENFGFDLTDEEDAEEIEAKKEIRKLFVNCSRVFPEVCLELIDFVLSSLQQPLSQSRFPPLEAALRLFLAFSESGQKSNKLLTEGVFPTLVIALHQTDITQHPHPQIVLVYYELASRFAKLVPVSNNQTVAASMTGPRGIHHSNPHVRARTAYFFFKLTEAMDNKASLLLPAVASFSDLLVCDLGKPSPLSDASELYLLEALGLMTSSTFECGEPERKYQHGVLTDMFTSLAGQLQILVTHPNLSNFIDEISDRVAHRICGLCSLSKGYNYKQRPEAANSFQAAAGSVCTAIHALPQSSVIRSKSVMFFHRLLKCVGPSSLQIIASCIGPLVECSDSAGIEEVVLLLNQIMGEFQQDAVAFIDELYCPMLAKLEALSELFEQQLTDGTAKTNDSEPVEAAHVVLERVNIQKNYLVFVHYVLANNCGSCLTSDKNIGLLERMLNHVLLGLRGESSAIKNPKTIDLLSGLILRRNALNILILLTKFWAVPSVGVSEQLVASYSSFLFNQILPNVLSLCSPQRNEDSPQWNVNDANTISFLTEIGVFLHTVVHAQPGNSGNILSFLNLNMFPAFGFSAPTIQQLAALLSCETTPAGTVREGFRKILRAFLVSTR